MDFNTYIENIYIKTNIDLIITNLYQMTLFLKFEIITNIFLNIYQY